LLRGASIYQNHIVSHELNWIRENIMGKDEKLEKRIEPFVEWSPFVDDPLEEADKDLSYEENPEEEIIDLIDEISDDKEKIEAVKDKDGWILRDDEEIYDLMDVVEEVPEGGLGDREFNDKIVKKVSEIAEKIAREIVPEIAEKVIREEIEKLKNDE
jgi:hypothetical protein